MRWAGTFGPIARKNSTHNGYFGESRSGRHCAQAIQRVRDMYDNRPYTQAQRREAAFSAQLFLLTFIGTPTDRDTSGAALSLYNLAYAAWHITNGLKDGADPDAAQAETLADMLHRAEDEFLTHHPLYADPARVRQAFDALRALVRNGAAENRRQALVAATWFRNALHNTYLEEDMRRASSDRPCFPGAPLTNATRARNENSALRRCVS